MLEKLRCTVLGHQHYVIQKFSKTERRVGCKRCDADWAMSDRVRALVDWNGEFEEMYEDMGHEIINPKF